MIELMGLLEHDDKERRRIAKEVEKEMEEAMQMIRQPDKCMESLRALRFYEGGFRIV